MSSARAVIEVRGLVKTYDDGRTRALDGADLTVYEGEFVAITGPSGCGKSTLLHHIAALERPDSGEIVVKGVEVLRQRDLSPYRSRTIGLIFQLHNLLPNLTASENVQMPMYEAGLGPGARRRRALALLAAVDLADKADKKPTQLSGGERQRVAIARALANDPPIVLADEPTGNLDSRAGQMVMELLRGIQRRRGVTLVLVSHDPSVAAAADRVVHMLDGRIVDAGEAPARDQEEGGNVEVRVVTTVAEMADALGVRRRVFIEEQGVSEAEEVDHHDGDPAQVTSAVHVIAYLDGAPVGTGRLIVDYPGTENPHVGRVAVLAEHRRHGVGRRVMRALEALASDRGYRAVTLAAQLHAIPFYERLGYGARGEVFLDAGIEHRWMDRAI
jgi:putative ABC transport system ATP-binding protein